MPTNGQQAQLPEHRQDDVADRLRQIENENNQLRGQINMMAQNLKQPAAPTQEPAFESPFDENVDQALTKKIQHAIQGIINPMQEKMTNQIGFLVDQNDSLKYNQSYSGDRFSKYKDKVESLRQDYQTRGQYIPREEALRIVYFEETGKKAAAAPPTPTTQEPKFDPYFGTMVNPETGAPLTPEEMINHQNTQQPAPVAQPAQPIQMNQMNQQPAAQVPAPPTAFSPQQPQNTQAPFPGMGELPQQGMNQPHGGEQQTAPSNQSFDVYASDDQLQAFENKFGDIPL